MRAYDLIELAGRNLREAGLRNSLTTLGVAVGAALYPAVARAALNCCPANGRCGSTGCQDPNKWYFCECGAGNDYCICSSHTSGCYNGPC